MLAVATVTRIAGCLRWWPRGIVGWSVLLLLVPVLILTLCRALAVEIGPMAWVIAFTPYFALLAALALVATLATRAIGLVVVAVACLVTQFAWVLPLYAADASVPETGRKLTVMTSNLQVGHGDAGSVVDLVRGNDVDLLAVEELTAAARGRLTQAGLDRLLPHRWIDPSHAGNAIWSRYPLRGSATTGALRWPATGAIVAVPGLRLSFVAVHPAAPLTADHTEWTEDQPKLREALGSLAGPVVVAGDFNATLDHRIMRDLQGDGYVDAVAARGAGISATWPHGTRIPFPLFAIDHVLQRGTPLVPSWTDTAVVPHSDHRAVIVTYRY